MSCCVFKKEAMAVVCCLLLVACAEKGPEEQTFQELHDEAIKNEVILMIGNSFYTNSDFEDYLLLTIGENHKETSDLSRSRLLDSFMEEKLLLAAARDQGIFLTEEEKKAYIARLSREFKLSEGMVKEEVEINTLLEKRLIEKFTLGLVEDISVSSEEIMEYYTSHKKDFLRQEKRRVSQILLKTEDQAIEVYKKVRGATEEEFRKIAREESEGMEASRGGEIGLFEWGQLPLEMDKVVFSLRQGQVSQVIESEYGYHIFRIDEVIKSAPLPDKPDQEVSSKIEMKILNQKINEIVQNYLERLKSDLNWDFYPDRLNFSYQKNEYE
ncbi:MAG: hypothetical protein GF421_01175 [Candidatus Aminicenantes bacterium]|nr:hypothetical protein [Candidatus Aminicenantes bacterium]